MKSIVLLLALTCSFAAHAENAFPSEGRSVLAIQGKDSFLRVTGEPAKELYDALTTPAKNDNAEAGSEIFYKKGHAYSCFAVALDSKKPDSTKVADHICDFFIPNPEKGDVKVVFTLP